MGRSIAVVFAAFTTLTLSAQPESRQTMKPLVRGTEYAASSMAPQATLVAEHVLRNGGNAFDAIVAGQAVLGIMLPARMASAATLNSWSTTRNSRKYFR